MNRIIVCGRLRLSPPAFARAQDVPLLKVLVSDPDEEVAYRWRVVRARQLFLMQEATPHSFARSIYDPVGGAWLFAGSVQGDEWANADAAPMPEGLAALKDEGDPDIAFTFDERTARLQSAWSIERGRYRRVEPVPALPTAMAAMLCAGEFGEAERWIRAAVARQL